MSKKTITADPATWESICPQPIPKQMDIEYTYTYDPNDLQVLFDGFKQEIVERESDTDKANSLELLTLKGAMDSVGNMLQVIKDRERVYKELLESGHYYSFFYSDDKHTPGTTGDICLILDGKKTGHIIPYDDLDDLIEHISLFTNWDDGTEKYEPIRHAVGSRTLLPPQWYIKLCALDELTSEEVSEKPESEAISELVTKNLPDLLPSNPAKIKNLISTIDKVTRSISAGEIEPNTGKLTGVSMGERNGTKCMAGVMLSFDPDEIGELTTNGKLNPYDMAVFKAVCSAVSAGNNIITISQINQLLSGKDNPRVQQQGPQIKEAMKKLTRTRIRLDVSKEAKEYDFNADELVLEDSMVSAMGYKGEYNKKKIDGYIIKDPPLLLKYAQQKKQLYLVPVEMLDTPVSKNSDAIVLQNYLLDRIQAMKNQKNKKKLGNCINYDSATDHVYGYKCDSITPKQRTRVVKSTIAMLKYWVEKGLISGFQEYKGKIHRKEGVKIMWDSPKTKKKVAAAEQ